MCVAVASRPFFKLVHRNREINWSCCDDYASFSDTSCMRAFTVLAERRCVYSEHIYVRFTFFWGSVFMFGVVV